MCTGFYACSCKQKASKSAEITIKEREIEMRGIEEKKQEMGNTNLHNWENLSLSLFLLLILSLSLFSLSLLLLILSLSLDIFLFPLLILSLSISPSYSQYIYFTLSTLCLNFSISGSNFFPFLSKFHFKEISRSVI